VNALLDYDAVIGVFGSVTLDETILRVGLLLLERLVEKVIGGDHV